MKKTLLAALVLSPLLLLSGCHVTQANYTPAVYSSDYVYSVGYYGYRPYYGNRYYTGYSWRGNYGWNRPYNRYYGRSWYARHW